MLKDYLTAISEASNRGDAREESYYPILVSLLEGYCLKANKSNIHITTLPKKTEAGNPDFRIWDGKSRIVGYIEAKAPFIDDLDKVAESKQLQKYLNTFANLILTNFLEFRLYRNGQLIDKVVIAQAEVLNRLKITPPLQKEAEFLALLEKFFSYLTPMLYTSQDLAVELAKRTRFLRDEVVTEELKNANSYIRDFYESFKDYLISTLSEAEFADLYSQTITYGLFAARVRAENGFSRKLAYDNIPKTIGILRDLFAFISLGSLPEQMQWILDDISEVLAVTDIKKILHEYFHEGKGTDPIIHFYETFLSEYDPKTREMRGVYYTPEPVVSYIVRSLHSILKDKFNKPDGFADRDVTVLDPSAGTMTFLAEVAKVAICEFVAKYGEGSKREFIKSHVLENFYGFELMVAPYAIGHLKMTLLLEELGYKLAEGQRIKLYLTNTLEMEELPETRLPGMSSLSRESHLAGRVKKEQPILVILGNPPYSGHSMNVGKWISAKIRDYYQVDGKPLNERNPKWLQDDYVKFIRFAQSKIEQAGEGIVGFITNHSYLDNPTFRGMRQSLMKTFDEIYLLDLHGNSLRRQQSPDGSKDENIFDIRQGVSIAIFIKNKSQQKAIYHAELWGLRQKKYSWLLKKDIKTTKWKKLNPKSEFYFFVPRDERRLKRYETYVKISDIFAVNGVGIVTARDSFVIDLDKQKLLNRIRLFKNHKASESELHSLFQINRKKGWDITKAWNMLQDFTDTELNSLILPILYRPFDKRWIFYHDSVVWRTVKKIMLSMIEDNISILTCRQQNALGFSHVFVSKNVTESSVISNQTKEIAYLFPLYIYPSASTKEILHLEARQSNINPLIISSLTEAFNHPPCPEEIFYYIYAVLYSNTYRTRYAEFLKIDFPKVPFAKDYELFQKLSQYGRRLADLHLLNSQELQTYTTRFEGAGTNKVQKVSYNAGRVYINDEQYFEVVPEDVWQYQIGGYQVTDKWLKDRRGKALSLDETQTYCRIITAISKTIEIQGLIDAVFEDVEEGA